MFAEQILQKKGLRNERFWTLPLIYRRVWLRQIPVWFDTHALLESQYWPREKLERLQDERIRSLLVDASQIPFWKKAFDEAGIDFSGTLRRTTLTQLPLTSKKDFIDLPQEEFTNTRNDFAYWQDHTSGSTGQPFHFFHDFHYGLRLYAICERMFITAGKGARFPIVTLRSRWREGLLLRKGSYFYLRGYNSLKHRIETLRQQLAAFKGNVVLMLFSSSLLELARLCEESGNPLLVHSIIATGEGLSKSEKAYIESVLKAEIFMTYVSRELGFFAFECEKHCLHICEEWAHVEIIGAEGNPLPAGKEGRVFVTTFDNHVMPFIRYDTGDLGIIEDSACTCGRTLKTMRVFGRNIEIITLPGDRKVSLLDVSAAFDEYWNVVRKYQIIQTSASHFVIKIVPGPLFEEGRENLQKQLEQILYPVTKIEIEVVDIIPETSPDKAVCFVRAIKDAS